jgi:hypothetical protein
MSPSALCHAGGGGARFQKAQKLHNGSAIIQSLEVQYNKSSMNLKLVFSCTLGGGSGGGYYGDDSSDDC